MLTHLPVILSIPNSPCDGIPRAAIKTPKVAILEEVVPLGSQEDEAEAPHIPQEPETMKVKELLTIE
ncbi:hypothetical protein AMTR_s00053p00102450 [Amborella trichopoda]|uniref:Uncharacterized protein n=1 Tax=Amborella trichopoda TaxID=13333 RepID=W1PDC2_AMBTC|nr:hypothetical protein AMTR_s00053p00102450 [Amborella trichopoda]